MAVRVLIVDDTTHVREMLAQMLALDGFAVAGKAASGREAIALVAMATPDIVIMDYKMPGMDGITATEEIRKADPKVPIILYTAYLDAKLEARAKKAGVTACIGKVEGINSLEREISALCMELTGK